MVIAVSAVAITSLANVATGWLLLC